MDEGNMESAEKIPVHQHQTVVLVPQFSLWKPNYLSSFTKSKQAPSPNWFIPSTTFPSAQLFLSFSRFLNKLEVQFSRPAENAEKNCCLCTKFKCPVTVLPLGCPSKIIHFLSGRGSLLALEMSVESQQVCCGGSVLCWERRRLKEWSGIA